VVILRQDVSSQHMQALRGGRRLPTDGQAGLLRLYLMLFMHSNVYINRCLVIWDKNLCGVFQN